MKIVLQGILKVTTAFTTNSTSLIPTIILSIMDILKIIIAIILPPLGVFLEVGISGSFWLNILLTLLGYLPGIIHAVWVIAKK